MAMLSLFMSYFLPTPLPTKNGPLLNSTASPLHLAQQNEPLNLCDSLAGCAVSVSLHVSATARHKKGEALGRS